MKKSWIKRGLKGVNAVGTTERQKEIRNTWVAFSKMVRERDRAQGCITCPSEGRDAGHFRRSDCEITQFHPMNVNAQCGSCNRFQGGRTFEHGQAIDLKYGAGWAAFLDRLSRKTQGFTVKELGTLKDAARHGPKVYEAVYFEIRPEHRFDAPVSTLPNNAEAVC